MTRPDANSKRIPRRTFLAQGAAAAAAVGVWSEARGAPSNSAGEKLNVGAIGVGNRGVDNIHGLRTENIAALCDVDTRYLDRMRRQHPRAATFRDFRKLIEQRDLDAVLISTPDHTHFHAALLAMQRGLHVYCERPLVQTVSELRRLVDVAKDKGAATQMGNQHHSSDGYRRAAEWVQSGVLGKVREVHSWTNRPLWPQGHAQRPAAAEVPPHLDWDSWLGPAPQRGYHASYHPMNWRGWWDFSAGALGDMGPHLIDPAFWGLKLETPLSVEAESSPVSDDSAPAWSIVRFEFAARGDAPPVVLTWYDGGKQPNAEVTGTNTPPANGTLLVGERARLFVPQLGGAPIVLPHDPTDRIEPPRSVLPKSPGHYEEWIAACKDGPKSSSSFDQSAALMETCLLGNVALRRGAKISWDRQAMSTGDAAADQFLTRSYRAGWEV